MNPANLLLILSDEHNPRVLGAGGHETIRTPNLDRLAARGARFTSAYCNSPICVPSRAALATGRYVHQIRFWDNGIPYDGSVPSWHHRLRGAGHEVTAIGKLHFRSADDDNGFTEEVMPLHVVDGIGDPLGWLRDPLPVRKAALRLANDAGPGNSSYQDYDDNITAAAVDWLKARAAGPNQRNGGGKPWVLFVSLVCPHFPLIARPEWYDRYPEESLPRPALYDAGEREPDHPYIAAIRECQIYDKGFDETKLRRALAAYFGLVSFVDHNVGRLLDALAAVGLADTTRVLYSSDHGDNLGTRRLWGKSTMYEESAGVPMIFAGPDIPQGFVCRAPVSLVDVFPTVTDCVGLPPHADDRDLPGAPLIDVVRGTALRRTMLCEYHAAGAAAGAFLIRKGPFKYVCYVGMPPQLFDLDADPQETRDLARDPGYRALVADCDRELRRVVDPEKADALARADQAARIAAMGGREAILARGSFGYSPTPGTKPVYN
ncbi:MAG TPA: sulfatase-like hydrolase/transferase [Stellaceae bacterium]|nr:sulfatase-like hydrolase/transferase [Stellaceae bacterium]